MVSEKNVWQIQLGELFEMAAWLENSKVWRWWSACWNYAQKRKHQRLKSALFPEVSYIIWECALTLNLNFH